jgi:hypothetical protein
LGLLGPIPDPMVVFEVIVHFVKVSTHKQNEVHVYKVFYGFEQAIFAFSGLVLFLRQFSLPLQMLQKTTLD